MASVISYQNVRLAGGRHASPADGVCVMELVSMLAGESFSDRPDTACPVIGAFLRAYNDLAGPQRQDLLACASRVVGSRRPELERARVQRCVEVALDCREHQPAWRRLLDGPSGARLARIAEPTDDEFALHELGYRLARLIRRAPDGRARALELVEELVAMGDEEAAAPSGLPAGSRVPAASTRR